MDPKKQQIPFFQNLAEKETGRKLVLILGLVGIALIFLSSLFSGTAKKASAAQNSAKAASAVPADADYANRLEQELTNLIREIRGAGSPRVLVTLEQGSAEVYAQQEKRSVQQAGSSGSGQNTDNTETSYIIVKDADGNERALTVTKRQPKVQGVVVACPGAANPAVQQAVLSAVSVAAGVSTAHICVVPSAGGG